MKLALHSLTYPTLKDIVTFQTLSYLKSLGFHGIEIVPIGINREIIDGLLKAKEDFGFQYLLGWSLGPDENTISPDKKIRETGLNKLKEIIELSSLLGARIIAGLNYAGAGYLTGKPPVREEFRLAVQSYREICDYAKGFGMPNLCLEPATRHDSHLINTAAGAVQFVRAVDRPNAKILLDTFQMLQEENDIYRAIVDTAGDIGYIHISESHRGTPGTGTVPWEQVFKALKDIKYNGWLGIESFFDANSDVAPRAKIWRPLGESPEAVAKAGIQLIKRFLEYE